MTTNPNTWFEAFISLMMMLTGFFAWRAKIHSHEAKTQSERIIVAVHAVHVDLNSRLSQLIESKEAIARSRGRDEGRAESKVEDK